VALGVEDAAALVGVRLEPDADHGELPADAELAPVRRSGERAIDRGVDPVPAVGELEAGDLASGIGAEAGDAKNHGARRVAIAFLDALDGRSLRQVDLAFVAEPSVISSAQDHARIRTDRVAGS
jgi:hypothetical protein